MICRPPTAKTVSLTWSRLNPDTAAITDAQAEIDGYLLSGGWPLPGAPANIGKYAVDIAAANLVLSAGVLESDPGGKAVCKLCLQWNRQK
jgi:hypothetical protein